MINHGGYLSRRLGSGAEVVARRFLSRNRGLFRLSASELDSLQLDHNVRIGQGRALLFRQTFDGVRAANDGTLAMSVIDGRVSYVSSAIAPDSRITNTRRLNLLDAVRSATADVGRKIGEADVKSAHRAGGWTRLKVKGFSHPQSARPVALPTPIDGVRLAYQVSVLDNTDGKAFAFTHIVDAETGEILIRDSNVDYSEDNPKWEVFPANPPLDYSTTDTRETWCWSGAEGCDRFLQNPASPFAWDVDARTGAPTLTSKGNNARGTEKWMSADSFVAGTNYLAPSPTRDYIYPWTNQWYEERCNPNTTFESPQRNDIDAALANLFAMHNRMHDWSYYLGFTEQTYNLQDFNFGRGGRENDPEHGNAQAGGVVGGPPAFTARDNANQVTPPDGQLPITNMFLWQPIAAAFYAPCVDGDYDMSVIGHEYTHAISNRMVAGPDQRLRGAQANAMGESWSDLTAVEYLHEYGFVPVAGENPFAVGPYVTGDKVSGIRNYGMNMSPLNYSNIGYDIVGVQVHADGEIWSGTNYDIRQAFISRYGAGDAATQRACADGLTSVGSCPGNRRWMQLVFDSYLLMPPSGQVSMVDARDAMLAADMARFGGANQDLLWNAFAKRGLGVGAVSAGVDDPDPVPSFESPHANEARVTFLPSHNGSVPNAQLFVGRYEARSLPVADTDPATALPNTAKLVPGSYDFIVRADGFGMSRMSATLRPGQDKELGGLMQPNLASIHNGATATGDGVNLDKLIDDTEATNWASLGSPVGGKQVTVRLDPSKPQHQIARVQVSALLRPPDPAEPPSPDPGGQNRYTALRQFRILVCRASAAADCSQGSQFRLVYTSPANAFPSVAPRPRAPDMIMRSFVIPKSEATHVRLEVVHNQCTGGPDFQGDQDDDPANVTDCEEGSTQDDNVRAAELQVFLK
jgi:extracellular elastinolytic metalloproteinase